MPTPNIDDILDEIRQTVRSRREEGLYPPGLEQELEFEFRHIIDTCRRDSWTVTREFDNSVKDLEREIEHMTGLTPAHSRIPGGSLYHRITRRLVARQVMGLAQQARAVSRATTELLKIVAEQQIHQEDADKRLVAHLSKAVLDRLAVVDHLAILVVELERRVDELGSAD